jgi:hypothetical protein
MNNGRIAIDGIEWYLQVLNEDQKLHEDKAGPGAIAQHHLERLQSMNEEQKGELLVKLEVASQGLEIMKQSVALSILEGLAITRIDRH